MQISPRFLLLLGPKTGPSSQSASTNFHYQPDHPPEYPALKGWILPNPDLAKLKPSLGLVGCILTCKNLKLNFKIE